MFEMFIMNDLNKPIRAKVWISAELETNPILVGERYKVPTNLDFGKLKITVEIHDAGEK